MWLPSALVLLLVLPAPQDPEATPEGRDSYLGRDVARTMHWRGAPWLLRETRENEENGRRLREWLAVRPGDAVCDLGCGNGYHTLPLAEAVGARGKVFAVDLQPEMLDLLAERAADMGMDNLVPIEATIDDPRLPDASTDLVLMVDVYHELSHPVSVLGHLKRALKAGGRIVLVEFRAEDRSVPIKARHKMTKAQVIREMAANGFVLSEETDTLPWQHAMAFQVAAPGEPRLEARALVGGFLAAAGGLDPRIVEPYLAPSVDTGDGEPVGGKALAVSLGEIMRGVGPPIPRGTRAELTAGPEGRIHAALFSPEGTGIVDERNELVLATDDAGRWQVEAWRKAAPHLRDHGSKRAFAAMHTGLGRLSAEAAAETLRSLGFDGVACDLGTAARFRAACEPLGLDVFSVYAVLDLDAPQDEQLLRVESAMAALSGGPGMVWLALRTSGPAADAAGAEAARATTRRTTAIGALERLARRATTTGVEVALYPHTGFWLATTEEALALAGAIDHPSVGLCFNLCHYLKRDAEPNLEPLLRKGAPRLMAVTINGADVDGNDWKSLIQPLGSGDHDLAVLLDALTAIDFHGPIGLQAYGIPMAPAEHLGRSMRAWRAAHPSR